MSKERAARIANSPDASKHVGQKSGGGGSAKQGSRPQRRQSYRQEVLTTIPRRPMRDTDVGDVLVERDGTLCGIVTDRDIVVRALAEDNGNCRIDQRDPLKCRRRDC